MTGRRDAGSGLARYVPAAGWLGGYQRSWLRGDLAAGLTTAAVASRDAELRRRGITLWLTNLNARPLDMLRRLPDAGAWEPRLFREPDAAAVAFSARPPRGAR